ncbi:ZZ-type zinc finger-containing protein 3 [Zancudomyces culisetae]|uniref:ZZ-type zinc finger-containing protein 3 n=1 Tax=Zancudomyces culisetae TaxID=1213189 RepID=A0A1R1PNI1_ZANCU|nr:ZZ-type zinc finger-containing protein 3 [Zancudomyces culisetae]OMH84133.1 ZZ-type zinc finger-containing protein 3 [Zancudomyces culisetae]|eukprot:OMH82526.1 ZZ-type zinc finger-containing protein 3 [Zancudomyces culisetae]
MLVQQQLISPTQPQKKRGRKRKATEYQDIFFSGRGCIPSSGDNSSEETLISSIQRLSHSKFNDGGKDIGDEGWGKHNNEQGRAKKQKKRRNQDLEKFKLVRAREHKIINSTLEILHEQLKQAQEDLCTLTSVEKRALKEPFRFLSQEFQIDMSVLGFLNGSSGSRGSTKDGMMRGGKAKGKCEIPKRQQVAQVPSIDIEKYRAEAKLKSIVAYKKNNEKAERDSLFELISPADMSFGGENTDVDQDFEPRAKSRTKIKTKSSLKTKQKTKSKSKPKTNEINQMDLEIDIQKLMSAGSSTRTEAATKTKLKKSLQKEKFSVGYERPPLEIFNKPWTDEEQSKLEELLEKYPDERVANNRWRKISSELGTRTMRQVASRVQKYFIKLTRLGLPLPGSADYHNQYGCDYENGEECNNEYNNDGANYLDDTVASSEPEHILARRESISTNNATNIVEVKLENANENQNENEDLGTSGTHLTYPDPLDLSLKIKNEQTTESEIIGLEVV